MSRRTRGHSMRAPALILATVLAALGGCTDPAPILGPATSPVELPARATDAPPAVTLPDANPAFVQGFSTDQCQGGQVWLNVDRDLLQNALPEPYIAGDAVDLVGPGALQGGVASLETYNCKTSAFGTALALGLFNVFIRPPAKAEGLSDVDSNWYQVALFTSTPRLFSRLEPTGTLLVNGSVSNAIVALPVGYAADTADARDDSGSVFSFETSSALTSRQQAFTRRVWNEAPLGTLRSDYDVTSDLVQGTARCTVRSGTVVHEVTQVGSCGADRVYAGWVWNDAKWIGTIVYTPHPGAS